MIPPEPLPMLDYRGVEIAIGDHVVVKVGAGIGAIGFVVGFHPYGVHVFFPERTEKRSAAYLLVLKPVNKDTV